MVNPYLSGYEVWQTVSKMHNNGYTIATRLEDTRRREFMVAASRVAHARNLKNAKKRADKEASDMWRIGHAQRAKEYLDEVRELDKWERKLRGMIDKKRKGR